MKIVPMKLYPQIDDSLRKLFKFIIHVVQYFVSDHKDFQKWILRVV